MAIENQAVTPFVGREREIGELTSALVDVVSGRGRLVMLAGEPGIGKSRIAQQLAAQAGGLGVQVYWGWCYEEVGAPPYWPWIQLLRTCIQEKTAEELGALLGPGAAAISEIVPELLVKLPELEPPPALDPEEARFRLFDSITTFWKNASQAKPTMIVVEDLHDSDRSSLLLLEFLARQMAGSGLLVVATYRDVEITRHHPLSQTLGDLIREQLLLRVQIDGLTKTEVNQLVWSRSRVTLEDSVLEVVHSRTNGNPLFLGEFVRLLGPDDVGTVELWTQTLPSGVRDVIGRRLSRLSEDCNQLLALASVIGREFNLAVLHGIADVSEDELYLGLKEAQTAGVIEEHSSSGAAVIYRFAHELFRQTLYEEILAPRRILLHRQVALALEKVYAPRLEEHAAELAKHYSYSSDPHDLTKSVMYSEMAARAAMSVYAYGEAAHLLAQALRAQEGVEPEDISKKCDLILSLGEALMPAGDPRRAVAENAVKALELAELLGDRERAVRACNLGLWGLRRYGAGAVLSTPEFRYWAEQADRYAEPGTIERAEADIALSGYQISTGRLTEGIETMRQALVLARALNHPPTLFWSTAVLLDAAQAPWHQEETWRLAAESNQWPRDGVGSGTLGGFLMHSGSVHLTWGDRAGAENLWAELEELSGRTQDSFVLIRPLRNQAILETMDGQLEAALETAGRLVDQAGEFGTRRFGQFLADQVTYRPLLLLGRADAAPAGLMEEDRSGAAEPTDVSPRRALCLAHLGHRLESQVLLDKHLQKLSPRSGGETSLPDLAELLETATLLEDVTAADILVDRLAELASLITVPAVTCIARHLGAAAMLSEDWAAARSYTDKALEVATKVRFRPEIALARLQLAELLLSQDSSDRVQALEHLQIAVGELEDMKMLPYLERARLVQQRDQTNRAERPVYPDGLTHREVEILRLIARGRTNREIGAELFVSSRTVDSHVGNILNKICSANRAEATAYASQRGLL